MNKELTPLEAYKLFLDDVEHCVQSGGIHYINRRNKEIVETALKEHEQYKAIKELCEKVVEKPIYEKYIDTHEIHEEDYTDCSALYSFKHNRIEFYMYDFVYYLELDQYGKTWAFTKEELL